MNEDAETEGFRAERQEGERWERTVYDDLRETGASLQEAVSRGETYAFHADRIVEGLRGFIDQRLEGWISSVEQLRGAVGEVQHLLGDLGGPLAEGLARAQDMLERGQSWLREHPEVVGAVLHLAVLGAVALAAPEATGDLLARHPEYLLDPVAVLVEHAVR